MRHNNTREHLGHISATSRPHLDSYLAEQAHARLENVRDAWGAACLARELKPDSAEVRELQLSLQVRAMNMRPRGAVTRPLLLDLYLSRVYIL